MKLDISFRKISMILLACVNVTVAGIPATSPFYWYVYFRLKESSKLGKSASVLWQRLSTKREIGGKTDGADICQFWRVYEGRCLSTARFDCLLVEDALTNVGKLMLLILNRISGRVRFSLLIWISNVCFKSLMWRFRLCVYNSSFRTELRRHGIKKTKSK